MAAEESRGSRGAREKRLDRLFEELRESIRKTDALMAELQDGTLKPKEPRRRF